MRHKEFWMALAFGALAGGIAALLYAPQSGASTRKKIRRGIEDISDTVEESAEYLKSQAENLARQAQKLIDYSKDQIDNVSDHANTVAKMATKGAKAVGNLM